jgi:hypothetical protein
MTNPISRQSERPTTTKSLDVKSQSVKFCHEPQEEARHQDGRTD